VEGNLEIDTLIRQNQSFAVYRLPGENQAHYIGGDHYITDSDYIYHIEKLNGFLIVPFRTSINCPFTFIKAGEEKTFDIPEVVAASEKSEIIRQAPTPKYRSRFKMFTQAIADKVFEKLVLSYCIAIPRKAGFSPEIVFYRACKRYIRSYVYLFHTPQTGTWMGSTPEVLLSGRENQWHTVALAGTQPLQNGLLPKTWDAKKREEQLLVTNYIFNCLESYGIHKEVTHPYSVQAGELAHLRTDFRFSLSEIQDLGSLLFDLHPTPAVCGLPKDKARRFIYNQEGYDRQYYSGYIGKLNPEGQTDLYVNLRCMQIEDNRLLLYAGGGLLASSDLEEEWREIEDKLQTMLRIID